MGRRRREANGEGPSGIMRLCLGNAPSVSCTHLGPVSLLGSRTRSCTLQGQRHSWAPPSALSQSPAPLRAFSGPVGPKHRPHPQPKPRPCLSPAPTAKAFSGFFFFLLFFAIVVLFYLLVVVSAIFLFFLTYLLVF